MVMEFAAKRSEEYGDRARMEPVLRHYRAHRAWAVDLPPGGDIAARLK